ncbi:RNA polymerase sigma-70 factor (ECF subfamily) [Neorhizobium galegae]|uniref:sigma factor-like helix-turn-helix DNA-binding protein n=1 Tax=Neorhizobium galegae TaxID=399 RepID=UPI001AE509DA|nr:sigma factor-like helix-turn-helix DNA-binding protein [Neorhizobium galegae]MBP2548839.1 RNA polymerase sigma-70 factor (ECF subfamily) [Neorhizobium galegae]
MSDKTRQTDIRRDLVGFLPQIRRFAMALTRHPAGIDQLVVRACEEAVDKSHLRREDQRLDHWVFMLMRTLWAAGALAKDFGDTDTLPQSTRVGAGSSGHAALDGLPFTSAPVFLLCAVEGLSYAEAATVMGITPDAVAVRMLLARRELSAQKTHASERRA